MDGSRPLLRLPHHRRSSRSLGPDPPPHRSSLDRSLSIGPLLLWAYSRTLGLPFGPEPGVPEAVGLADCADCALEVVTLITAVILIRSDSRLRQRPPASAHVGWLITFTVVAITALGVGGSGLGRFNVMGDQMTMTSSE